MDPTQQQSTTIPKDSIIVTIRNRQGLVTEEEVKAISSINERGPFDVLPQHANFISIIKDSLTLHKKQGQKQEMKIGSGVLRVYENRIEIYLEVSVIPETSL